MKDQKLENLLEQRSFVLWIREDCSTEEKDYWDLWLKKHPNNQLLVEEAKDIINGMENQFKIPDSRHELDKLNKVIDRYEVHQHRNSYKQYYRKSSVGIAAGIVLLVALLSSLYVYNNYQIEKEKPKIVAEQSVQKYNTDYGEKLIFRLSDGSRITLNGNSSLIFSSKIEGGLNTDVTLEGEAYFNIAHLEGDQKRTFTVNTKDGSIQVLGTRFGVNTFRNETQTVLEEGKIRIHIKGGPTDTTTKYMLEPGELARFIARDNKIRIKRVDTKVYTSWTEGKLLFDKTPMEEVAQRIEDVFGIEVVINEKLSNRTLSGSIKSDNLAVFTKALSKILNRPVERQDQELIVGE